MRFFVKCDICNRDFHCEGMKLPKEIILNYGLDMCDECRKEFNKRINKMKNEIQKERFNKLELKRLK